MLAFGAGRGHLAGMDLDSLLHHYFGTDDLDSLDDATIASGQQRIALDFGVEREAGRRFALWVLLHTLGDAPDPAAFKEPELREAAQAYSRAVWMAEKSQD
jgi:uncharacterized protein YqfA (UPF0365 family)